MKAILLSGGQGRRLQSISAGTPKPLMPILGTPLLEHIVIHLRDNGFTELCFTLCYRAEQLTEYFGDGSAFGVSIQYTTEKQPLGTAGAVRECADFVGQEPVLVMSGDCACDYDLRSLMKAHQKGVTIALSTHSNPISYGLVVLRPDGRVAGFLEKPEWERVVTDRVSTGIYVLSPDVLSRIPKGVSYDFGHDLFPALLSEGYPLYGKAMEGYWQDIGTPRAYYQCNLDALDGKYHLPESGPCRHILPCADRARIMRLMSESLAEFGADYSDGLTLNNENGRVRCSPLSEECSLLLEGDASAVLGLEKLILSLNP